MKIYRLACSITVSAITSVEANSLKEAIDIAKTRDAVISNGRDGNSETESWIIDEADGLPDGIHAA